MARRPKRGSGIPSFPVPTEPRFRPAYYLLAIGLALMLYRNMNPGVRSAQDLATAEGTLINYSFKKTAEGKKDYGFWLVEHAERFVLPDYAVAAFDTAAFKATVKKGERLRIEYNPNANPRKTEGNQRIYSLTAPNLKTVYLQADKSIGEEQRTWMDVLAYVCLIASLAWFVWQVYERNQQKLQEDIY